MVAVHASAYRHSLADIRPSFAAALRVWGQTLLDERTVPAVFEVVEVGRPRPTKLRSNTVKERFYALDNFRDSSGVVAARISQFVHTGRIHSHPSRAGGRGSDHQPSEWPKHSGLIQRLDRAL